MALSVTESKKQKPNQTKIIENIEKEINWKPASLVGFPRGEYPTSQPVVKMPQTASVKATQPIPTPDDKLFIYLKESGNDPYAINLTSGACGLGQALPCSKLGCALGDYACQDKWFTQYMLNRYGSWANAKAFWLNHGWW